MAGIYAYVHHSAQKVADTPEFFEQSELVKQHKSGHVIVYCRNATMCFCRDASPQASSAQPFHHYVPGPAERDVYCFVGGQITNSRKIADDFKISNLVEDLEIVLKLYLLLGSPAMIPTHLNGLYSVVIIDVTAQVSYVFRNGEGPDRLFCQIAFYNGVKKQKPRCHVIVSSCQETIPDFPETDLVGPVIKKEIPVGKLLTFYIDRFVESNIPN